MMKNRIRIVALVVSLLLLTGNAAVLAQPVWADIAPYKTTAPSPYVSDPPAKYDYKRTILGWEGDKDGVYTYIDGSYQIRDGRDQALTFGISSYGVSAKWYMAEHYLPCLVSEYTQQAFDIKVENFGDKITVNGNDYVAIYTRMTVTNHGEDRVIPLPSAVLTPLDASTAAMSVEGAVIKAGETVVREYALVADRFGNGYDLPTAEELAALGGFETHYTHMRDFWTDRLSAILQINEVPAAYEDLLYAYRAAYIYALITKDGDKMNVNEDQYDELYNHDFINIFTNLLQLGDYAYYGDLVKWTFDTHFDYEDGFYKVSFPFAYYLMKTGDTTYALQYFGDLQSRAHYIGTRFEDSGLLNPDGTPARIMTKGTSLTYPGVYLLDSQAALAGLKAYRYVCQTLLDATGDMAYGTERNYADALYDELFKGVETVLENTMRTYNFRYLPMEMFLPNELSIRASFHDSNLIGALSWGFWSWDGYLFGADETDCLMYQLIDETYTHMLTWRRELGISDSIYTTGAYSGPDYSTAYNPGRGIAGLRGELYRDWGIEASMWMIRNAQVAPYAWSEKLVDPSNEFPSNIAWDGPDAYVSSGNGGGYGPHIWGMSQMTQTVTNSFIAERADGVLELGSGLPCGWITDGQRISIANYAYGAGNRMGYTLETVGDVTVKLTVDALKPVAIDYRLPVFLSNITAAADGSGNALAFDSEAGLVTVPAGVTEVTVTLTESSAVVGARRDLSRELEMDLEVTGAYTAEQFTATSVSALEAARREARTLIDAKNAAPGTLQAALDSLTAAYDGLTALTDGVILANDQCSKSRLDVYESSTVAWQTVQTGASAGAVSAVDVWVEKADGNVDDSVTFPGLQLTVYSLNPSKYLPYRLGDVLATSALGTTGADINRWHFTFEDLVLEPDTSYGLMISVNTEDFSTACGFRWMLTSRIDGEYLTTMTESGTKTEQNHLGSGSYRIYFGTTATKKALNTAAADALALDLSGYSADSAKRVTEAVSAIDALLRKDSFTAGEQDSAISALQTAVASLTKAPDTAPDTAASDTEPAPAAEKTDLPVWGWVMIGCAAVLVVVVAALCLTKKKKIR